MGVITKEVNRHDIISWDIYDILSDPSQDRNRPGLWFRDFVLKPWCCPGLNASLFQPIMWQVTMVDVLILDTSWAMVRCTHCLKVFKTIPKQISSSAKWTLTHTHTHSITSIKPTKPWAWRTATIYSVSPYILTAQVIFSCYTNTTDLILWTLFAKHKTLMQIVEPTWRIPMNSWVSAMTHFVSEKSVMLLSLT